jgi:hypothetical protein
MGMFMFDLLTVSMRPWAIESQRTMPPFVRNANCRIVTKDIDKDGGDFGIVGDEFEGFFDGFGGGSSSDVFHVNQGGQWGDKGGVGYRGSWLAHHR